MKRWQRRLIRGLAVTAGLLLIAAIALPWWLPFLVRAVGGSHGVEIASWEHDGWSRIAYRDIAINQPGIRGQIAEIRMPSLGLWPASGERPVVSINGVSLAFGPAERRAPSGPSPSPSIPPIVRSILSVWPQVEQWLPSTHVNGAVVDTGGPPLQLESVSWDGAALDVVGTIPGRTEAFTATLSRESETAMRMLADVAAFDARLDLRAQLDGGNVPVTCAITWRENRASTTARFGTTGLMPETATFDAPDLVVPADDLGLEGYAPLEGSVRFDWTGDSYVAVARAQARPLADDRTLPPVSVDLRATGDLETVRVESASVRLPGVDAQLSSPLEVGVRTGVPRSDASFSVAMDLEQIPWPFDAGHLSGRADVAAGEPGAPPSVAFQLAGEGIAWRDLLLGSVALNGSWRRDRLEIERAAAQLGEDSSIELAATVNLRERRIDSASATANVAFDALRPLLPTLPEFARLTVEVEGSGAFEAPDHSGSLSVSDLQIQPDLAAGVSSTWQASGVDNGVLQGQISTDRGIAIPFSFASERGEGGDVAITINELAWVDEAGEWWRLSGPASLRLSALTSGSLPEIALENLRVRGEGVSLDASGAVRWPVSGSIELRSEGLDPSRLAALVPSAGIGARLDSLNLNAEWNDGPATLDGAIRATYAAADNAVYSLEVTFRTGDGDLGLGVVRVMDASGVVLEGEGKLPLQIAGRAEGIQVGLPRDGDFSIALNSAPNPVFWDSIGRLTGWRIEQPSVEALLTGSIAEPRGNVDFWASAVRPPDDLAGNALPALNDLHFVVTGDDSGVALSEGVVAVAGKWITLRGHLPWSAWETWRAEKRVAWRRAEFALASEPMPMAIVSRAVPTVLAPDGEMSFELKHQPASGFSGRLWLHRAGTRPIPPLGTVRDIDGEVTLDAYDLRLKRLTAQIGGRPIEISGAANIRQRNAPVFGVHISSSRVPLVRDQGVVLRASLNLDVEQTVDRPAHVSGTVDLGSSVFVSDLASLLPTGGVSAPEQRPPYFSVRDDPYADWTLDVAVQGDKFMRIENPFFKGTLSADLQLDGTLAEPRAIGRVWSQAGTVTFPFGNVPIEQLEVTLSPENPYEPQLFVLGATRLYGYDLRMEASGSASDPRLFFSSDPPATSQQIFLLLTTGQMPDTDRTFTTEERARRLALFVGRALARDFGIGGGQGQEQLIIRSGEDFSREGETYHVQYNLDGRWSLVGEYDRFDAYNGGVKFRLIDR